MDYVKDVRMNSSGEMWMRKSCRSCKYLTEVYFDVQGMFAVDYRCSKGHPLISYACDDYEGDTE